MSTDEQNQDVFKQMETLHDEKLLPEFIELRLTGNEPAWCVDGRPDFEQLKGVQMLGGSLHPILLSIISAEIDFNEDSITQRITTLQEAGYTTGAHRGSHNDPEHSSSDCGFADKLLVILQTAVSRREEITLRLNKLYESNKDAIGVLDKPFSELIDAAFAKIEGYDLAKISLTGERLVAKAEQTGTTIENSQGDHAEKVVFINLNPDVTLDTNQLNQQGNQAFNLDLKAVIEQAGQLGVDPEFALAASLILYQATEMVLVEDKGNPALPVVIHK